MHEVSTAGTVQIRESRGANGRVYYEVHLRHDGLGKYKHIRNSDSFVVRQKAQAQEAAWNAAWASVTQKNATRDRVLSSIESAKERTQEAEFAVAACEQILSATLAVNDQVDWNSLKQRGDFATPRPQLVLDKKPAEPSLRLPPEPLRSNYVPRIGFFASFSAKRVRAIKEEAARRFESDLGIWRLDRDRTIAAAMVQQQEALREWNAECARRKEKVDAALRSWEEQRTEFGLRQRAHNDAVDERKGRYEARDEEAITDYFDLVLSASRYPLGFPQEFTLEYRPSARMLLVEYVLPPPEALPRIKSVSYRKAENRLIESELSEAASARLFDCVIYQVCLRTIHEVFESDYKKHIDTVVFNGIVTTIDKSHGRPATSCIVSVQTSREEFMRLDLAHVEAKQCFKSIRGVGSSKLAGLTPIAPLVKMDKDDRRFVEGRAVEDGIDEGDNLAAMDWEDFEHLIRELFEREFRAAGGEVKITRASRDGGVDAVVFDPDPIRGGKIVIQAKRYTNTVGVSAVRDLYGTLMSEGANKGILVTTADYGPDAYEFARGKPITLLNGANLLHLLSKHGTKARIDVREAKRTLSEL